MLCLEIIRWICYIHWIDIIYPWSSRNDFIEATYNIVIVKFNLSHNNFSSISPYDSNYWSTALTTSFTCAGIYWHRQFATRLTYLGQCILITSNRIPSRMWLSSRSVKWLLQHLTFHMSDIFYCYKDTGDIGLISIKCAFAFCFAAKYICITSYC